MSYEKIIHINDRGQLVIPKNIRKISGLNKSSQAKISLKGKDTITIEPLKGFASTLEGSCKGLLKEEEVLNFIHRLREGRE